MAMAIYTGNRGPTVDTEDTADKVYRALSTSTLCAPDEAKADVYAQLAEQRTADTTFERAVNIIEVALDSTEKALGHGSVFGSQSY